MIDWAMGLWIVLLTGVLLAMMLWRPGDEPGDRIACYLCHKKIDLNIGGVLVRARDTHEITHTWHLHPQCQRRAEEVVHGFVSSTRAA